ncbi:DUF4148 domain-containing protein [Actimicrobium antarcticum]|uniref:DUF4148 domain-containing protein n=1 Tax=Actimicrobium antarcticum TaxID=1051899 RepID=A0ABP7TAA3_9BURK
MNVKKLIAAVAVFAAAGSVFAGDLMPFTELDNFKSTKTRADVVAEVNRDRAEIALARGDIGLVPAVAPTSTRTRLAVRKEAIESAHNQKSLSRSDIGG